MACLYCGAWWDLESPWKQISEHVRGISSIRVIDVGRTSSLPGVLDWIKRRKWSHRSKHCSLRMQGDQMPQRSSCMTFLSRWAISSKYKLNQSILKLLLFFFFLTLPHHVVLAVLELTVVDQGGFEHRPACLCPPRARITRLLMVILIWIFSLHLINTH